MSDARAEAIVRRSAAYRAVNALISGVEHAWTHSLGRRMTTIKGADRIRSWAITAIVAAMTALLLGPFGTTPRPAAWLVPAIALAIGLLVVVFAPRR